MRVHRVHLKELSPGEVRLTGQEAHHLAQVLRVSPGAKVKAFDGQGQEAQGEVVQVNDMAVTLHLAASTVSEVEAPVAINLAVALLKGNKLSDIVRMGTELGVACFQPFVSARCEVKILSANKLLRLRRVAQEASKQSGRSVVPEVAEACKVSELERADLGLLAHPEAQNRLLELLSEGVGEGSSLTLVTGPEGGLSAEEVADLSAKGFKPVRLGARILRAETAPIALTAAILLPEGL